MSDIITINNTDIRPGEHAQINLSVAKLPTHTLIDLPVYIYRGKKKGRRLLLTAGLHGDELNGVETIRRMIVNRSIVPEKGMVIAIPIVNIFGFLQNERHLPDRRDLNRSFPGLSKGSLASRIAYTLMKNILPLIDYGVDFHTGGAHLNHPQVRCVTTVPKNLELAKAFKPPFIVNSKLIDKSFRKESAKMGKEIIVFEGGESLRFDEVSINKGIEGTMRLMRYLRMKTKIPKFKPVKTIVIPKSSWIRASTSGLFRSKVRRGEKIVKDQVVGTITDPFGETETKIKSRYGGYTLSIKCVPIVNRGDAVIHIGIK